MGTEAEATLEQRARDVDFLRHNCGTQTQAAKGEATFEQRARDVDFLRHNYGTQPRAAKVGTRKPLQTQGDRQGPDCRQDKR